MLYNTQQLLFSKSYPVKNDGISQVIVPKDFYINGFTVLDHIKSPEKAHQIAEQFISTVDPKKLPFLGSIQERIQLAKADAIPICDDSVETSFQALHFDMGQPLMGKDDQLMITTIALYHPYDTPETHAKTRVLPLGGLCANKIWGTAKEVEQKIIDYVTKHGDGWDDVNTYRISCVARLFDALTSTTELAHYRDKTMAQWFKDEGNSDGHHSLKNEQHFYQLRNVPLDQLEVQIDLLPGQMAIIDNTRVAHGRIGKRTAREIYQFMFGLQANPNDINHFREMLISELTTA